MSCILTAVYRKFDKYILEKYKNHTILLDPKMNSLEFNLNNEQKNNIFNYGYLETIKFSIKKNLIDV